MRPPRFLRGQVTNLLERWREGTVLLLLPDGEERTVRVWVPTWRVAKGDRLEGTFMEGRRFLVPAKENSFRVFPSGKGPRVRELGHALLMALPRFGYQRAHRLAKDPEAMSYLLGEKDLKPFFSRAEWGEYREVTEALRSWNWYFRGLKVLLEVGFTPLEGAYALEELGAIAADLARENPFLLCQVRGIDYLTLAARLGRLDPVGALLERLKAALWEGGETAIPLESLGLPAEELEEALKGAKDQVTIRKGHIGLTRIALLEDDLLEALKESSFLPPLPLEGLPEDQREAGKLTGHRLAVLTGGPGTGKTFTTSRLLEEARRRGIPVTLTATTGKAAQRLSSLADLPAATLHRTLGVNPFQPFPDPKPFPKGLVVLDEASMVTLQDLHLALRALPPGGSLLLVGDVDQLPPVGSGAPFAGLVGKAPTVRLTKVRRQEDPGALLLEAARAALEGRPWGELGIEGAKDLLYRKLQAPKELDTLLPRFLALYGEAGFSPEEVQVLTPIHTGPYGTQELNGKLQRFYRKGGKGPALELGDGHLAYPGDKLIFGENRPQYGVMNGTVGVLEAVGDRSFLVRTESGRLDLPRTLAWEASLGYAITVHRSQGSEWPVVILVLPPSSLTTRKVVYTALTRAKRQALVLSLVDLLGTPLPEDPPRRTFLSL